MRSIVLASQSPRRKQLLEWAEVSFEIFARETAETYPAGLATADIPVYIARAKAEAVRGDIGTDRIILAADTVVVLDEQIIGKPKDPADAVRMLSLLSGRKHQVITGVVLMQGEKAVSFSELTEVNFHPLSQEQIRFYVEKYKPFDKAGAYAIQEWIGVTGIESIRGDFYNVMGLPVSKVVQLLEQFQAGNK
ncbi:MAG: septum formation protein Maf [Williamsia sp.]|nr:septum formation protein Maf [Williamsia sp.]